MSVVFRSAVPGDRELLHELIFRAWRWDRPWNEIEFHSHRESDHADSYVVGFGERDGDQGVVAELGGRAVGAAWCRILTGARARAGYVADDIPELAMAVVDDQRGRGIGRDLLSRLIDLVRAGSSTALSLHVAEGNVRARALYDAAGFVPVACRESGSVMRLDL